MVLITWVKGQSKSKGSIPSFYVCWARIKYITAFLFEAGHDKVRALFGLQPLQIIMIIKAITWKEFAVYKQNIIKYLSN